MPVNVASQIVRLSGLMVLLPLALASTIWPAWWNGFPIVYDDDTVYLSFPATIRAAMPQFYGMALADISSWGSLSDGILIQGVLTTYVLYLAIASFTRLRAHAVTVLLIVLVSLTQLPWLASQLTTDFLGALGLIAILTLAFRARRNFNDILLLAVVILSCIVATANIFVLLPLAIALTIARPLLTGLDGGWSRWIGLAILIPSALLPPIQFNMDIHDRPVLAIGSSARLFNKLVDHGIAQRHLTNACTAGDHIACKIAPHVKSLTTREQFLWGSGKDDALADRLDAWNDRTGLFERWSMDALRANPGAAMDMVVRDAFLLSTQLTLSMASRDHVSHAASDDGVRYRIKTHHGDEMLAFLAARQQQNLLAADFPARIYVATTLLGYMGLVAAFILGIRKRDRWLIAFCGTTLVAILWSTLVHGGLSLPIPRYNVKASWLGVFAIMIVIARLVSQSSYSGANKRGRTDG